MDMVLDKTELEEFVDRNEIGEDFGYDAEFIYPLYKDNKLVAVVAYMLEKDKLGNSYPRFIHVIFDKSIRKTKEAVRFVFDTFEDIKSKGYNFIVAVIPNWKKYMQIYATKVMFKRIHSDENYGYWVLNINDALTRRPKCA